MSFLSGYKTYIVAAVAIIYAAVQWWNGGIPQTDAIQMVLAALGGAALRNAVPTK